MIKKKKFKKKNSKQKIQNKKKFIEFFEKEIFIKF